MNVDKICGLLERTAIFTNSSLSHEFDDDFFWREVRMPPAKGSDKQASMESCVMSAGEEKLFNVLCTNEDTRMDEFDHCDDECDADSLMSSQAGSIAQPEEMNDDTDNEDQTMNEAAIASSLRNMANVKRKPRSDFLYKELLGIDGNEAMKDDMDVNHLKEKAREKYKEMVITVANRHFEYKMEKRLEKLAHKRAQSSGKSYRVMDLGWRNRYRSIMDQSRK